MFSCSWLRSRCSTIRVLPAVALLALFATTEVVAAPVLLSVDDTWVREDNPTSNRNGNDQMNLRTDIDADDNDAILLRFDLSSLSGPQVGATTLRLFWQRTTTDSEGKIMKVYGLNEGAPRETTWLDDNVIYGEVGNPTADDAPGLIPDGIFPGDNPNNPGGDGSLVNGPGEFTLGHSEADIYDLDEANTTFLGEVVTDAAVQLSPQDFVSTDLTSFINGKTNGEVTLLLFRDQTTSGHQLRFIPSEVAIGASMPGLSPTLLFAPEPTSLALLGLGGLVFAAVRRRR